MEGNTGGPCHDDAAMTHHFRWMRWVAASAFAVITAIALQSSSTATLTTVIAAGSVAATVVLTLWMTLRAHTILTVPLPTVELDDAACRFLSRTDEQIQLRLDGPGEEPPYSVNPCRDFMIEIVWCTVVSDNADLTSEAPVVVMGHMRDGQPALLIAAPEASQAVAAVLLDVRDRTGRPPQIWFGWPHRNSTMAVLRCLLLGAGDLAVMTRERLHHAEPDPARRPQVHVG